MRQQLLILLLVLCSAAFARGQGITVRGTVVSLLNDEPLVGVNVVIQGSSRGVVTDTNGEYAILCKSDDVLVFSYIGYESIEVSVDGRTTINVQLSEGMEILSEVKVYATGYQEIPPERATGSFENIDQELINRSTSTDIISRLENVTAGLLFDKRLAGDTYGDDFRTLRIRGVNSIESDNSPLIVVDNFPYEGDLNNINPNDVESITVLRDAAAASIWGARAANGVIVITMKKGSWRQPFSINYNSNVTIGETPDLHYSPDYLPSAHFIETERELFGRGFYNSTENNSNKPVLSPVVELLISERDGLITAEELDQKLSYLSQQDVRDEAENYFYRNSIKHQQALNIRGGTDKMLYYLAGGYDKNLSSIDGNEFKRVTLVSNNTFRPVDPLEIHVGLNFTGKTQLNNGLTWGDKATQLPYNTFADENGNWMPVVNNLRQLYIDEVEANGLLDWQYRPLQEKALNNSTTVSSEVRINTGLTYKFLGFFNVDIKYQYQKIGGKYRNLQDEDSYYVRHQVNRFTQADGTKVFPAGNILTERFTDHTANSVRGQLNFSREVNPDHYISALAGAEAREVHVTQSGLSAYGYDDDVLTHNIGLDYVTRFDVRPRGRTWLPEPGISFEDLTDRYISYFGNASYTYKNRYILSGSVRWDASNLFGVKTNQKGVPLWSAGVSWDISEEGFYNSTWLPYLRLRATYGYNGNINKSVTAYPTVVYTTDFETKLPMVVLRSPGNPQLKWEKIGMINVGIDFEFKDRRIAGSIEFYDKHGEDIIGEMPLDPTTGVEIGANLSNKVNYAETKTTGMDIQLNTINVDRAIRWTTNVLFTYTKNEILDFYNESIDRNTIFGAINLNNSILPQEGRPIDGLYSLPWYGLDPATGNPQVVIDEQPVTDYRAYAMNLTMEDLVYHGVNVAPVYGAVRNNVTWKDITLSANISWKAGYYFRRSSINYNRFYNNWMGHRDFIDRWQEPGDEVRTQVPSMPDMTDSYRDMVYTGSELLIEKGDHIRLEDINLSYSLIRANRTWLPFNEVSFFIYARNLGILWSASKKGLDPDYPNATYLQPRSYSIGINAKF